MQWKSEVQRISLSRAPKILRMSSRAVHGLHGVERFRMEKFWCLNLYHACGELSIGSEIFPIQPGYASITAPGVDMEYHYEGEAILTWVHFIPAAGPRTATIPVMQSLGKDFDRIRLDLREVCSLYHHQKERASARLWDILWRLANEPADDPEAPPARHPALAQVMDAIEERIAEPLQVSDLAKEAGLSQTHLNRLFRASVGMTVSGYLRVRRLELAQYLLTHTTLPVKLVAIQTGMPDPHHFNKLMRRYAGVAPTRLRHRAGRTSSGKSSYAKRELPAQVRGIAPDE